MNTRKDNNGRALKAWRNTPPGHIAKPLRFIASQTNGIDSKGHVVMSAQYVEAARSARYGNGLYVQQVARSLIR